MIETLQRKHITNRRGTSFPLADANGNCVSFIDEAGNVQAHYTYDAFGNTVSSDGDMDDVFRFRFSSKYLDDETGFYFYGYRYYAPALGRWVSRDPIGIKGGLNLYDFVGNDAVANVDSLGLLSVCCSPVRDEPWPAKWFRHCHTADICGPGEDDFPVWTDDSNERTLDNGKPCNCATQDDLSACIRRHPYNGDPRGPKSCLLQNINNNCQTSVQEQMGSCCLKTTWRPDWYAEESDRGRCLRWHYVTFGPGGTTRVCLEREYGTGWRGDTPPEVPDPRIPGGVVGPHRPPPPSK